MMLAMRVDCLLVPCVLVHWHAHVLTHTHAEECTTLWVQPKELQHTGAGSWVRKDEEERLDGPNGAAVPPKHPPHCGATDVFPGRDGGVHDW